MSAFDRVLDALRTHDSKVTGSGRQRYATCPAHEDRSPSLSVTAAESRVLLRCHAGCDTDDVLTALGLSRGDLFDEPGSPNGDRPQIVATYPYTDENDQLLFQVVRMVPKTFRQRRPDGAGDWAWNLDGVRRVLYRLPSVLAAVRNGRQVFVVEGEKDVHAVEKAGAVATTNPGGAGKWRDEYGDALTGAHVVVVADRDEAGYAHARAVAADLIGKAASVTVVEPAEGNDLSDHLNAGRMLEQLVDVEPTPPATHRDADADAAAEADLERAAAWERDVDAEAHRLRVREAARQKVDAERLGGLDVPAFDAGLLGDILIRPGDLSWRIEGLLPSGGRMLTSAQRKAGKTTYLLSLARVLILGGDFLGSFPVTPITGRVGILNYEVTGKQLAAWADDVGVPRDRLYLVNLRGRRNPLGNDQDRELLVERLRAHDVEVLMVDPFGRAFTGQDQNANSQVTPFLADLDGFADDAGCSEVILTAHAGWDGERTRNSSALEDWPDSIVTIVRGKDDDERLRYLRAIGRDVEVEEDRLDYDQRTRRLTLTGAGSRKAAAADRKLDELTAAVIDVVAESPGLNVSQVTAALKQRGVGFRTHEPSKALARAVDREQLHRADGPNNSKLHYPSGREPPPTLPGISPGGPVKPLPPLPKG